MQGNLVCKSKCKKPLFGELPWTCTVISLIEAAAYIRNPIFNFEDAAFI